jgi:hypothetical protein
MRTSIISSLNGSFMMNDNTADEIPIEHQKIFVSRYTDATSFGPLKKKYLHHHSVSDTIECLNRSCQIRLNSLVLNPTSPTRNAYYLIEEFMRKQCESQKRRRGDGSNTQILLLNSLLDNLLPKLHHEDKLVLYNAHSIRRRYIDSLSICSFVFRMNWDKIRTFMIDNNYWKAFDVTEDFNEWVRQICTSTLSTETTSSVERSLITQIIVSLSCLSEVVLIC